MLGHLSVGISRKCWINSNVALDQFKRRATSKAKRVASRQKAKPTVNKVEFLRGSEESVAERNRRLKRECKGGVNAGACAGHTR